MSTGLFVCLLLTQFVPYCHAESLDSPAVHNEALTADPGRCPSTCHCSKRLRTVDCSYRNLDKVPTDIPTWAKTLCLNGNRIQSIPAGAFAGLRRLESLDFADNRLASMRPELFEELSALRVLNVSGNRLRSVPNLTHAFNIREFDISLNRLDSIRFGPESGRLSSLRTLTMKENYVENISGRDAASLPTNVEELDISSCGIVDIGIDVTLFPCRRLRALNLALNPVNPAALRRLLNSLRNCSELRSLNLFYVYDSATLPSDTFASLVDVPLLSVNLSNTRNVAIIENGTFRYFGHLKTLDISDSDFSVMSDTTLSAMTNLTRLRMVSSRFTDLPALELPSLEWLDLSYCSPHGRIRPRIFRGLQNLTTLNLTGCRTLRVTPDVFDGLHKLEVLDISNCKTVILLNLAVFHPLTNLQILKLSQNLLLGTVAQNASIFAKMTKLKRLDMSSGGCDVLPPKLFDALVKLEHLDLAVNNLGTSSITAGSDGHVFDSLVVLRTLILRDNGIRALPAGLFDRLAAIQVVDLSRNELKTLAGVTFVTSLVRSLSNVDVSRNKISVVTEPFVDGLPTSARLRLRGNPFSCSCELVWFRRWIAANATRAAARLPDLDQCHCDSPSALANVPLLDFDPDEISAFCSPPPWKFIVVGASCAAALVALCAAAIAYRYRWSLRLRMYYAAKGFRRCCGQRRKRGYHDIEQDSGHDLLVSYFDDDEGGVWVVNLSIEFYKC